MFLSWKCLQSIPLITHWVLNACLSTAESGPKANKFVENSAGETEGKRESNLSVFTLPVTTTKMKSHGITFHRNKIYKRGNKKKPVASRWDVVWSLLALPTSGNKSPAKAHHFCAALWLMPLLTQGGFSAWSMPAVLSPNMQFAVK